MFPPHRVPRTPPWASRTQLLSADTAGPPSHRLGRCRPDPQVGGSVPQGCPVRHLVQVQGHRCFSPTSCEVPGTPTARLGDADSLDSYRVRETVYVKGHRWTARGRGSWVKSGRVSSVGALSPRSRAPPLPGPGNSEPPVRIVTEALTGGIGDQLSPIPSPWRKGLEFPLRLGWLPAMHPPVSPPH